MRWALSLRSEVLDLRRAVQESGRKKAAEGGGRPAEEEEDCARLRADCALAWWTALVRAEGSLAVWTSERADREAIAVGCECDRAKVKLVPVGVLVLVPLVQLAVRKEDCRGQLIHTRRGRATAGGQRLSGRDKRWPASSFFSGHIEGARCLRGVEQSRCHVSSSSSFALATRRRLTGSNGCFYYCQAALIGTCFHQQPSALALASQCHK